MVVPSPAEEALRIMLSLVVIVAVAAETVETEINENRKLAISSISAMRRFVFICMLNTFQYMTYNALIVQYI